MSPKDPADSSGVGEPRPLRIVRTAVLATLLLGMVGTSIELILLEHTEDVWQQIPLWLLGLGLIAVLVTSILRRPASLHFLRAVMAAFIASGLVGTWWHYEGNVAFELEMYPSRQGWELFREALAGATPTLAAGTMLILGLLGLIYTVGHPLSRKSYIVAVLGVLLVAGTATAQDAPPIDHALAAEYFAEARALERANPWPGTLQGPILLVDRATRYVVANQPDEAGRLESTGEVFVGTLPDGVGIANTATTWEGEVWTMMMWPLPVGRYARGRLIGHELFHRLGPELGLPMANPTNAHLDTAEGRLWFRLEMRALTRAVANVGDVRRAAVADVLAFRRRRHRALPDAAPEERALELNEGLAEYTGVRVSIPPPARAGWTVQRTEAREVRAQGEAITRNFAYTSGPGLGLLLDDALPGWHERVRWDTDLAALLAEAYGVDPSDLGDRADRRMSEYEGHTLRAFEERREQRRLERQAELRALYVEGPVLRLPVDEQFGYSFDPNTITVLEGVGQVLAGAEVRGGWGVLNVSGDVLLERSDRGVTGVVVPAPTDITDLTKGEGWTLRLHEDWQIVPGARTGDWLVRPRDEGG